MNNAKNIFTFEGLPRWMTSRLSLVARNLQSDNQFDFFIQRLDQDDRKNENNTATVLFLTSEEIIQVYINLTTIDIHKFKRTNIDKIDKLIYVPKDDCFSEEEVDYNSVELSFNDGANISISKPLLSIKCNMENYRKFIGKL